MTEVLKRNAKLWIFLISTLCIGGIVYGVYKATAMVNRLSFLCFYSLNLSTKLLLEGNNDGLLDELKDYSKEDLRKLAKAIEANKQVISKI